MYEAGRQEQKESIEEEVKQQQEVSGLERKRERER